MRWFSLYLLSLSLASAGAQTPATTGPNAPPLLSPQAAYDQALAPVNIVHRDLLNWSDTEIASLDVAIAQARDACSVRTPEAFAGDELISYARLCALGKQWATTYTAATTYINSKDALKPQLAMAYMFEVQADLNMDHEKAGLGACLAMLQSVPYGPLSDEVTTTTVRYLQFAYTQDALSVLAARQPFLLNLLNPAQYGSLPPTAGAGPASPANAIPLHTVFEHALEFAALEQFVNQPGLATVIVSDIDKAMPLALPPDEAIFIAADRRQYALIGTHFPTLPGALSLQSATETPLRQPNFGFANVFLLFPPWCAQCVRQAQQIVPALVRTAMLRGPDDPVYIYALLADKASAAKLPPKPQPAGPSANKATAHAAESSPKPEPAASPEDLLRKTPTLVVAPSTLTDFNASDFPFLIATDHNGIIRLFVPAAPQNALVQGGPIEQITDTILTNWPPHLYVEPKPKP